ncbi:MAG: hypothetical protein J6P03_00270 [Opitutales bacterium]|nr:hypothetical protein [Opitutales bacterium]
MRVSMTLPRPLLSVIDAMAKESRQTRSGFIVSSLAALVEKSSGKKPKGNFR